MSAEEKCAESMTNGFQFYDCGRPVKRDGKCGIHAAAADRIKKNEAKRRAEREASVSKNAALAVRLAHHGIVLEVSGFSGAAYLPSAERIAAALDAKYGGAS